MPSRGDIYAQPITDGALWQEQEAKAAPAAKFGNSGGVGVAPAAMAAAPLQQTGYVEGEEAMDAEIAAAASAFGALVG